MSTIIPILLGRPFLATSKATIDLERNKLIIKIDDEIDVFKCGYDSQCEGLLISVECYVLFDLNPNDFKRGYSFSCVVIGKRIMEERDKWKEHDSNGIDRANYDGRK